MKLSFNQALIVLALSLLCVSISHVAIAQLGNLPGNSGTDSVADVSIQSSTPHLDKQEARDPSLLPPWLRQYLQWHSAERLDLSYSSWKSGARPKLLILQCMWNDRCGGFSDRLNSLPVLLLCAYRSKRLFLIRWRGRPTKLEEFMVPPKYGLDWRVPQWLDGELGRDYKGYSRAYIINPSDLNNHALRPNSDVDIITARPQWGYGGEKEYLELLGLPRTSIEFYRIYNHIFRICFMPSMALQREIDRIFCTTNLTIQGSGYAVAHFRALYFENKEPPALETQVKLAQNAVNCASQLGPSNRPIYFATDSQDAQKIVQRYADEKKSVRSIVVLQHEKLVHLDRVDIRSKLNTGETKRDTKNTSGSLPPSSKVDTSRKTVSDVSEIFPVFVDVWLMANGNCLSHGDGGYGKFGLMVSQNISCGSIHSHAGKMNECRWRD